MRKLKKPVKLFLIIIIICFILFLILIKEDKTITINFGIPRPKSDDKCM